MFVKICALTDPGDAAAVARLGPDAIGTIFAPSRRRVDVAQARAVVDAVRDAVGTDVLTVGVFRDHTATEVLDIAGAVGLDAAQLHGAETPATSARVHAEVPILFRAMAAGDPELATIAEHGADVVLVDAPIPGGGVPFDWHLVGDLGRRHRLLLAGGLRPDNVAEAIATVDPWGVDVCSGVEAEYGRKDLDAVARFIDAARTAAAGRADAHPPLPGPTPGTATGGRR